MFIFILKYVYFYSNKICFKVIDLNRNICLEIGSVHWERSLIFFIVHVSLCFIINLLINDNYIKEIHNIS